MASMLGRALARPATAGTILARPATAGTILALPATLLMLSLVLVPVVLVIGLSTTDWPLGARSALFLGPGNDAEMFADATFRRSLMNTLLHVGFVMPASVGFGLGAALLIEAGLLDTNAALVLPSSISVFAIFLLRQFFRSLPEDLINAARMDGLSEWSIVWRIALPAAWPALTAFGILSVVAHRNDLF